MKSQTLPSWVYSKTSIGFWSVSYHRKKWTLDDNQCSMTFQQPPSLLLTQLYKSNQCHNIWMRKFRFCISLRKNFVCWRLSQMFYGYYIIYGIAVVIMRVPRSWKNIITCATQNLSVDWSSLCQCRTFHYRNNWFRQGENYLQRYMSPNWPDPISSL